MNSEKAAVAGTDKSAISDPGHRGDGTRGPCTGANDSMRRAIKESKRVMRSKGSQRARSPPHARCLNVAAGGDEKWR